MIDFIFVSIVLFLILPVLLLVTFVLCFVNKRAGAFLHKNGREEEGKSSRLLNLRL